MKSSKSLAAAALIVAALSLLGCYWTTGAGSGELDLGLSGFVPKGPFDYYGRVYLLADGVRFALQADTEYIQVPLSTSEPTTLVLDGIPAGPVYVALVAIVQEQPEGWYSTDSWGESAPFVISPGKIVPVPVALQGPAFYSVTGMMGIDVRDVEAEGTSIYAADAGNIYNGDANSLGAMPTWSYPVTSGHRINSLTMGQDFSSGSSRLWANTDRGILVSNGEGFEAQAITASLGAVSVLDSDWGNAQTGGDYLLHFRRTDGFGGTYIPSTQLSPAQWTWVNVDSERTLDLTVGLEQAEPYQSEQGLLATAGGAFRVPEDFLKGSGSTLPIAAPAPVRSLFAFNNDGREQLYIGTENGAFRNKAWSDPDGRYLETGTAGYPIRKIAYDDWMGFRAYLSDAYIFIEDNQEPPVLKGAFPFVSGFPGRINAIKWVSAGATIYLLVATDQGLFYWSYVS